MAEESNGSAKRSVALFFTAGGILGAALAVLFAPSEGRRTRVKIKEFAEEVKEKTNRLSNTWREKTARFLEKSGEVQEATGEVTPSDIGAPGQEPLSTEGTA
jgi:gas vesicle protein